MTTKPKLPRIDQDLPVLEIVPVEPQKETEEPLKHAIKPKFVESVWPTPKKDATPN